MEEPGSLKIKLLQPPPHPLPLSLTGTSLVFWVLIIETAISDKTPENEPKLLLFITSQRPCLPKPKQGFVSHLEIIEVWDLWPHSWLVTSVFRGGGSSLVSSKQKEAPLGTYQLTLQQDTQLATPILLSFNADKDINLVLSKGSSIFALAHVPVALSAGSSLHCFFFLPGEAWMGLSLPEEDEATLPDLQGLLADHRIIEYFGLEGTFRGHLAQPSCSKQGHLQLDQVAQSPIQPGPECV